MMTRCRVLFGVCLPVLASVGLLWILFEGRHRRSVTLRDLTPGETQTVSVAFPPHHANWKISGRVEGTGIVMVAHFYSNRVSGTFSAGGGGDYYETNASVAFIPEGEVTGRIRASFRFHGGY